MTYNIALETECVPFHRTWPILFRSTLVFVVGIGSRMFDQGVDDNFPRGSLTSWFRWFGLVNNERLQITKSQTSRAGIPSMRKHASRETTSASVELMLISNPQNLLQVLKTILICNVVLCFPHDNSSKRLSHALVHFVSARASLFTNLKTSSLPIRAKCRHVWTNCEQTVDNSPTDPFSSSPNWWSSMHGVATLYNCSVVLFASSQYLSKHLFPWPSMFHDHEDIASASRSPLLLLLGIFIAPAEILDSQTYFRNYPKYPYWFNILFECNPWKTWSTKSTSFMEIFQMEWINCFHARQFDVIHIFRKE